MDSPHARMNSECLKYKEDADFYKTISLITIITILALTFAIILVFKMMRSQVSKLLQIHDFGLTEDFMRKQMINTALDPNAEEGAPAAGGDGNPGAKEIDMQQKSRDAIVRIIKFQLDQYLKHSNANYDIENINYNFLEKNAYDQGADPFRLVEKKDLLDDVSKQMNVDADPAADDINMPDFIKQKVSSQEAEIMMQFRQSYDLNVLYQRHASGEKINRLNLDIKDARQLQLFLLQLKQFLLMMQASGTQRAIEALKRFEMLKMMWFMNGIRQEVETTVSLMKLDQVTDAKILCNKEQIIVIAQILKICDEDAEFLEQHLKKQKEMNLKLEQQAQNEQKEIEIMEAEQETRSQRSNSALIKDQLQATLRTNQSNIENQFMRQPTARSGRSIAGSRRGSVMPANIGSGSLSGAGQQQ